MNVNNIHLLKMVGKLQLIPMVMNTARPQEELSSGVENNKSQQIRYHP